mmetsp:Transcript_120264/g.209416  ORF Transcript_120264/g.209416 Transcript_120264/m.209416 type:complete len:205 (+) Transcript_120264:702-1316(+)
MTVGTPKPRALSPVVRQSPTLPPPVAQSPKMLMMRDTPQGKRKKALPASVKKLEGPRDQKNLLQWKHRGLQLLNYHEQFVSLHSTATTAEWKASSTALSRMNRHEWIQWANKAHGEILYQFKKQAERWIQESKYRLTRKNRQANKRLHNTPRGHLPRSHEMPPINFRSTCNIMPKMDHLKGRHDGCSQYMPIMMKIIKWCTTIM